jgi:hypothetical protein
VDFSDSSGFRPLPGVRPRRLLFARLFSVFSLSPLGIFYVVCDVCSKPCLDFCAFLSM